MAYVIIVAELVASFLMIALFSVASAFQDEGLRFSTPITKALDVTMFLVLLAPTVLALISLSREMRGRPWPLKPPWWFLTFLACGFATVGLLVAKDEIGHAARQASDARHRAELIAGTQQGDGAKACELVCQGPQAPREAFPVCRAYIEQASSADERLRRFEPFTLGGWLRSWPEGEKMSSPVPASEQVWFVRTFFTSLVEATPGSSSQKPAPTRAFDDLLSAASALGGVGRPELLTHEALCAIAAELPQLEAHYAARLAQATTQNPERATYFRSVMGDARARAGACGDAP